MQDQWALFFGAIAAVITATAGAYAIWRKLKPETTNIQVTSAETLVTIATKSALTANERRDVLEDEVAELRAEVTEMRRRLDSSERRAREAEMRAENAEAKVEVLARKLERSEATRKEREAELIEDANRRVEFERQARILAEEREQQHAAEVRRLWVLVHGLREVMRANKLVIPDQLEGGIGDWGHEDEPNDWTPTGGETPVDPTTGADLK